MRELESIEATLARLMPVAISSEGQRSLDEMMDELFGEEIAEMPVKSSAWKWALPAGMAAALAIFLGMQWSVKADPAAGFAFLYDEPEDMVLMGESDRIETMTDEGWLADTQGGTMQAVRVQAVEENTFRDEKTGILVQISEPREELLLFPVNAF